MINKEKKRDIKEFKKEYGLKKVNLFYNFFNKTIDINASEKSKLFCYCFFI